MMNRAIMLAFLPLALSFSSTPHSPTAKPHIVYLLADDLGWNNVGYHAKENDADPFTNINYGTGQDIKAGEKADDGTIHWTPTIDRLATEEGARMDRYYTFKFCGPSRSALQSGRNPLHVNIINDAMSSVEKEDPVTGFSGMARDMTGMAEHMKQAGYKTVFSGKWHVGMATLKHVPKGRGYDYNLGYLDGVNNNWNHMMGEDGGYSPPVGSDTSANEGWASNPTHQFISLWESTPDTHGPAFNRSNSILCDQFNQANCTYEDELFGQYTLDHLDKHNVDEPLFLIHAFHIAHNPLEIPHKWLDKFPAEEFNDDGSSSEECFRCEPGGSKYPCSIKETDYPNVTEGGDCTGNDQRRVYTAMVAYMDDMVNQIEKKLKEKGMWENTLLVFSSDNGGPTYRQGAPGANNYPLRGGKRSAFEGGVRTVGFISGGFLPSMQHGKVLKGFVAIEDWYGTFLSLAGGDPYHCLDTLDVVDLHPCRDSFDPSAAAAGLPPIDSVNVWPYLKGEKDKSPRHEIVIAAGRHTSSDVSGMRGGVPYCQGLIDEEGYKLIVGPTVTWQRTSPQFPNKGGHYLEADGTKYIGTDGTAMSWDCSDIVSPLDLFAGTNFAAHTDDPTCQNPPINQVDGTYMKLTPDPGVAAGGLFPGCFFNVFDGHDPKELETTAGNISNHPRLVKMRKRMLALDKTTGAWQRLVTAPAAGETSNKCGGEKIDALVRPLNWYQEGGQKGNAAIRNPPRLGEKYASIDNGYCNYIGPFLKHDDERFEREKKKEWLESSNPQLVRYCKEATGAIAEHCVANGLK